MQRYSITQALGLPEYKVTDIQDGLIRLRIQVEPYKYKKFICSKCGEIHAGKINSLKEVSIEDLKLFDKQVQLIVTKRRMRCPQDGKLHVVGNHPFTTNSNHVGVWGKILNKPSEVKIF